MWPNTGRSPCEDEDHHPHAKEKGLEQTPPSHPSERTASAHTGSRPQELAP